MHDINKIRENKNLFIEGWEKRGLQVDIANILYIDKDLRKAITDLQDLQTKKTFQPCSKKFLLYSGFVAKEYGYWNPC